MTTPFSTIVKGTDCRRAGASVTAIAGLPALAGGLAQAVKTSPAAHHKTVVGALPLGRRNPIICSIQDGVEQLRTDQPPCSARGSSSSTAAQIMHYSSTGRFRARLVSRC